MSLSTVFFKESIRHKRLTEWELHVNAYKALKAHLVLPSLPGTEGIDFIAGHLDILDRKLGSLLTFHGMLAAVVGLYLNVFLSGRVGQLSGWFWAFAVVWMATTLLCLLAMAWVPWGNLGDKPTIPEAESGQIQALIGTVITPTAFFRLAVPLTFIWLLLFALTAWTTKSGTDVSSSSHPPPNSGTKVGSSSHPPPSGGTEVGSSSHPPPSGGTEVGSSSHPPPSGGTEVGSSSHPPPSGGTEVGSSAHPPPNLGANSAIHSELLGTVGPFTSGFACSNLPVLEDGVLKALSGVQRINPTTIRLIGSADVQSLRPSLTKEFGNNAGLALTRARCVAGWLAQALGPRTIPFDLMVQDAVDRSPDAMKHGSASDRRVQVWAIP